MSLSERDQRGGCNSGTSLSVIVSDAQVRGGLSDPKIYTVQLMCIRYNLLETRSSTARNAKNCEIKGRYKKSDACRGDCRENENTFDFDISSVLK